MRLRLVHTLSLLLLSAVLLAVLGMGAVTAWNLKNGFADYLLARDVERLDQFAALVAEEAARAGSLAALEQRTDIHDLLRAFAQRQGLLARRAPGPRNEGIDRPGDPGRRGRPPGGPPPNRPPRDGGDGFGSRVIVVGVEGQQLLGRNPPPGIAHGATAEAGFIDRPIRLNGAVIALARLRPGARVPDAVETGFLRSQYLGIFAVAAALLLLALLSAWWVARRWARPLVAVQAATERIARGEFDVRLAGPQQGAGRSDEIGDLVRNVNRMAAGLQQLESARRRWLADISHELRTPLAVLRGEIEALVDGVRPLRAEAILSLREDTLRLGTLVDDLHLLAMSDLQALPCNFVDLDAVELVRQTVARFQSRASAQGLALRFDSSALAVLPVCWDRTRVEQLLANLLENSLRYTDAPGRVQLTLRLQGEHAVIEIDDSAPGVPAADLPRLFEPLYRADAARSRHRGGSGLGLAICHAIAHSHGGRIEAVASGLGGLRLRVELPTAAAMTP